MLLLNSKLDLFHLNQEEYLLAWKLSLSSSGRIFNAEQDPSVMLQEQQSQKEF